MISREGRQNYSAPNRTSSTSLGQVHPAEPATQATPPTSSSASTSRLDSFERSYHLSEDGSKVVERTRTRELTKQRNHRTRSLSNEPRRHKERKDEKMADHRYRPSGGRRSPTFNPARASVPVNIGHHPPYQGDPHTIQTGRYDASIPRRAHDYKEPPAPTTTITTYNVTKDPGVRRSSSLANRHRSSTLEPGAAKPIIVTTNRAARPHASSSQATSSSGRTTSPTRDTYRSTDEAYYTQPASSIRSRSHQRNSQSYSQSATLSNDEYYRLRERVGGDDRLRAPTRAGTEPYRSSRPHSSVYVNPSYTSTSATVDYKDEGYEYTQPSDLARYDLDHGRDERRDRRDSIDRSSHRPHVNVASHDPSRYEARPRERKPPTAAGLDRFNRYAAAGIYDRPSVTMPALPPVPAPPPIDVGRRPALIEGPRSPSVERRTSRPRPVSLYQDGPTQMPLPDDPYRSREDEQPALDRRGRDDPYRDERIPSRGFGLRLDASEQIVRPASATSHRDYDHRPSRRDVVEREPKRRSDESMDRMRKPDRKPVDEPRNGSDESLSRRDSISRRDSVSRRNSVSRARDKVVSGLGVAAAAIGLAPKDDGSKNAPRRRPSDEENEILGTRAAEKQKARDHRDIVDPRSASREDPIVFEQRRESRRERGDSVSRDREFEKGRERERERERDKDREPRDRDRDQDWDRERDREIGKEREREKEREQRDRERDREKEREKERHRLDAEAKLGGLPTSTRESLAPSDSSEAAPRRRARAATFNPTDTKDLMNLKAELAAIDTHEKPRETIGSRDPVFDKDATSASALPEKQSPESPDASRGRELVPARDEKQVRVVSPPRDKSDQKPIKGILKQPKVQFPEDDNPVREGVAPHKDDKTKKDVPSGARWTRIRRSMVNPEALTIGKERFEVRDDFVIVLRVLSKDEIQAYATATAQLRELHRKEHEDGSKADRNSDDERNHSDEERQRRHRHRREREDDETRKDRDRDRDRERDRERERERERDRDRDRDREDRHRRYRDEEERESRPRAIEYDAAGGSGHSHHHGSHSHRGYESIASSEDRR